MALRKFALNVGALSIARAIQTAASILAIPVLARLLDPEEFGLLALATPFVFFGLAIGDAGLGQSLVRVRPDDKIVWSSAFWLMTFLGVALMVFLLALALPVSWIFAEPVLAPMIAVLSIVPLLQSTLAASIAEMQQREQFRTLAGVEVVASLVALASALALAFAGVGVWALICQATLYWVVKATIVWPLSKFRPSMHLQWSALEGHLAFSRDSASSGLVSFFQRQIDPLVIGKFLGGTQLGLYSMANRLVILPFQLITAPVQNALYVRMVALRNDRTAIRDLVVVSALFVAIGIFPMMAIGAVASEAMFRVFLSDKWADAAIVFSIIAPVAAVQTVAALWTPMLMATENTALRLRLNIESAVVWLIIMPFAATQSIVVVATAYTLSYFLHAFGRSYALYLTPLELKVSEFFGTLIAPITVSIVGAAFHLAIVYFVQPAALLEVGLAIVEVIVAVLVLVVICRRTLRANMTQLRGLLSARVGEGSSDGVPG